MKKQLTLRPIDLRAFGRRLREMILVQYDSVGSFADSLGMTRNALYNVVHGDVVPSIQTLVDICELLGCSLEFLLGISTSESDRIEGYEAAVQNIRQFRDEWTPREIRNLHAILLGDLSNKPIATGGGIQNPPK